MIAFGMIKRFSGGKILSVYFKSEMSAVYLGAELFVSGIIDVYKRKEPENRRKAITKKPADSGKCP